MIIRPFPAGQWRRIGNKVLESIKHGQNIQAAASVAFRSPLAEALGDFFSAIFSRRPAEQQPPEGILGTSSQYESRPGQRIAQVDEKTLEIIQSKLQKQVFEANIRFVASAKTKQRADEIIAHLTSGLGQFALSSLNSFKLVQFKWPFGKKRSQKLLDDFIFRRFVPARKMALDTEELTSVYHFPTRYIETPYIKSVKSTAAPPPEELRRLGVVGAPTEASGREGKGINVIGQVVYRGETTDVYFATRQDRRRHFYIVGQTGTGKTSLLREMIRQDIQNGEGVAIIDPHGDLIEDTLANIPKNRVEDVVLFEPFDMERPVGLNMLEYERPNRKILSCRK